MASSAATIKGLQDIQRQMRDFSRDRQTPFGVVIPKFAIPIQKIGFATAPDYGSANQIELVSYTARPNWYAVLCGIVLGFVGNTIPLPGDLSFAVDIDRPLGSTNGYPVKDFGDVEILLGSFTQASPWPCEILPEEGETVRIKAFTIQNVSTGDGAFLTACLMGFEWPKQGYEG